MREGMTKIVVEEKGKGQRNGYGPWTAGRLRGQGHDGEEGRLAWLCVPLRPCSAAGHRHGES